MCNRYRAAAIKAGLLPDVFDHRKVKIRWPDISEEMFPDRVGLVARLDENGQLAPDAMRWGFPKVQASYVTNVRNTASRYWAPWLKAPQRCLVAVTAFAEWSAGPPKGDRWFERADGDVMMFAGIWRPWTGARGTKAAPAEGEHRLFAFLTTTPNAVVAPVHPKAMPVVLERADWDAWLTGAEDEALALQRPAADDVLRLAA